MALKDLIAKPEEARMLREIARLRTTLNTIQEVLRPADNATNVYTVGRAREIALAALKR